MNLITNDRLLPESLEYDTVQLLVRNPTTLFAYWSVSARKRRMAELHFRHSWSELQHTLRVYDTTGIPFDGSFARGIRDIRVGETGSCYLRGMKPGRSYIADIGITDEQGQFFPLCRSEIAQMPGDAADAKAAGLSPSGGGPLLPHEYERFSAYSIYVSDLDDDSAVSGGEGP